MTLVTAALAMLFALRFMTVSQRKANQGHPKRALAFAVLATAFGAVGAGLAWSAL